MAKRKASEMHVPGGVRQQLAWTSPTASASVGGSEGKLSKLLIQKWAWGAFAARLVQQIAAAAVEDGANDSLLTKLSKVGSSGLHPERCHADLLRILPQTHVHDAFFDLPVWVSKRPAGFLKTVHQVLLPHQLLHVMYTHHRQAFVDRILGGGDGKISEFWTSMQNHPGYAQHPLSRRVDHKSRCIPIALHGDGVPVAGVGKSWSKSMDGYSWASLLCTGSVAKHFFLIYALFPKLVVPLPNKNALDEFFKVLSWSLYWMFLGVWPKRDHTGERYPPDSELGKRAGTPLAGGYYGVLWCLRGDLEHMCKVYGFPFWNTASPCGLCACNRSDAPWTDATANARWRSSVWDNDTWRTAGLSRHVLFDLPGAGVLLFIPDVMHTLHLGVYQYYMGSVLEMLTLFMLPGSAQDNMDIVWGMVLKFYKDLGPRDRTRHAYLQYDACLYHHLLLSRYPCVYI